MQRKAFTLIELMVVVAVIAILATLAISNFSAAIRRARNAGRQSAIQAVAKGLETCYDVPSGTYTGLTGLDTANAYVDVGESATGPFDHNVNKCLNESITPDMSGYPYSYKVSAETGMPQAFVVCAMLEKVPNWGSVGNLIQKPIADVNSDTNSFPIDGDPCEDDSTECYFCVTNQQ